MNKSCQNCHQLNPPEAAFCLNCSSPLFSHQAGGQAANKQWNQSNFGGGAGFTPPPGAGAGASQRAIMACILAIVGLFLCGPFTTLPAIFMGWSEISAIKQGQAPPAGRFLAGFGLWGGIIITVFHGGVMLLWVLLAFAAAQDPYGY